MKILAIASKGGHWVQLLRIAPALDADDIVFVSTNSSLSDTVSGYKFYSISDGNRGSLKKLFHALSEMKKIVNSVKPDVIITTGSAPGLMGIIAGRLSGIKTIWVDSIANADKMSTSGKLAVYFADRVYTQWEHLANSKVLFNGNVLS